MRIAPSRLPEVLVIEPRVFGDARGFLFESWNEREFEQAGIRARFVQDNHSRSARNVVRGLHYQIAQPQGKLVRVVSGEIFDVAVDVRRSSPTFGKWTGARLSAADKTMMWIPVGFAHGFAVLSESADVLYKVTDYYAPEHERTLLWNDPRVGVAWPLAGPPVLSAKDAAGTPLERAEAFP